MFIFYIIIKAAQNDQTLNQLLSGEAANEFTFWITVMQLPEPETIMNHQRVLIGLSAFSLVSDKPTSRSHVREGPAVGRWWPPPSVTAIHIRPTASEAASPDATPWVHQSYTNKSCGYICALDKIQSHSEDLNLSCFWPKVSHPKWLFREQNLLTCLPSNPSPAHNPLYSTHNVNSIICLPCFFAGGVSVVSPPIKTINPIGAETWLTVFPVLRTVSDGGACGAQSVKPLP